MKGAVNLLYVKQDSTAVVKTVMCVTVFYGNRFYRQCRRIFLLVVTEKKRTGLQ